MNDDPQTHGHTLDTKGILYAENLRSRIEKYGQAVDDVARRIIEGGTSVESIEEIIYKTAREMYMYMCTDGKIDSFWKDASRKSKRFAQRMETKKRVVKQHASDNDDEDSIEH